MVDTFEEKVIRDLAKMECDRRIIPSNKWSGIMNIVFLVLFITLFAWTIYGLIFFNGRHV